jgi:sugar-specific transcriptional regulator TrmB
MESLFDNNGMTSILKHFQELSLGKPEKYNGDDLARAISNPLNDLNKQLANLQEAVSNFKGNGSGEKSANNMYNVMAEIDQRIEPLPTWFETIVSRLDDLSRLAGKLDSEFEKIRLSSKNESNFENRWWQFGRSAKK